MYLTIIVTACFLISIQNILNCISHTIYSLIVLEAHFERFVFTLVNAITYCVAHIPHRNATRVGTAILINTTIAT